MNGRTFSWKSSQSEEKATTCLMHTAGSSSDGASKRGVSTALEEAPWVLFFFNAILFSLTVHTFCAHKSALPVPLANIDFVHQTVGRVRRIHENRSIVNCGVRFTGMTLVRVLCVHTDINFCDTVNSVRRSFFHVRRIKVNATEHTIKRKKQNKQKNNNNKIRRVLF